MDVMFGVRNTWEQLIEHKATPNPEGLKNVLNGIINNYYKNIEKPIIIDKCRGWVSLIEMAEYALGHKIKIIVPVRDLRDILSSFELLWRKKASTGQIPGEQQNYIQFQTVEGRCDFWCRADQPVGIAYNRIKDAINRGLKDRMLFVHFERLTNSPETVMSKIYKFLELPEFIHNFDYVEQVTKEDDAVFGFDGLHTIKNKVEPIPSRHPIVLGRVADKFEQANYLWSNL